MDRGGSAVLLGAGRAAPGGRLLPLAVQLLLPQPQRGHQSQVRRALRGAAALAARSGGVSAPLEGCSQEKILCLGFVAIIFPVALRSSYICRGLASENTVS